MGSVNKTVLLKVLLLNIWKWVRSRIEGVLRKRKRYWICTTSGWVILLGKLLKLKGRGRVVEWLGRRFGIV